MVKHTDKIDKLIALVEANPTVFIGKPDWNAITTQQAIQYAYLHNYSWSQKDHQWRYSQLRAKINAGEAHTGTPSKGTPKFQIRVMGPLPFLEQLAIDLSEVADLIGLRVTSVSQPVRMKDSDTWGRVYISVERE